VELWNGGAAELWNCGAVELWNGGPVELWNVGAANSGAVKQGSNSERGVRGQGTPVSPLDLSGRCVSKGVSADQDADTFR
jgi:hypothetical protein